jgi:serine/threonine-protein kinase
VGGDEAKTRTGMIIGTPLYMSPEQARGLSEADSRTDLYAVGVILYEAVTGRVPFTGASPTDLLFQIALSTPPPIPSLVNDVDPAFCSIVEKAMARDPGARFQTGAEFIAALDAWAQRGVGVTGPVAVPTQVLAGVQGAQPTGVMSPYASTPAPTGGTPWASSQNVPMPPKRRAGLVFALVGAGLVAVAAVVGMVVLRGRTAPAPGSTTSPSLASAPPSALVPPPPPVVSTEPVTLAPPPPTSAEPSAVASTSHSSQPLGAPPPPRRAPVAAPASANNGAYNPFGHL